MLMHPQFDPIALKLGPVAVHWYGLTYLAAFLLFIVLGRLHARRRPELGWNGSMVDDLLLYGILGVVIGGRLGYCLFYRPDYYLSHPLDILYVWQGGMSFHGGLLGVIAALWLFARRRQRSFWNVADFVAPLVPLGLASGRLGNFINGELVGRATDPSLPWAMVFPRVDALPRHPSQLYQFALEGVLLFIILWCYARAPRAAGRVSGAFLLGYGVLRFIVEFFRDPDDFLGLLSLGLSMGQWLCLPMIALGCWLLWRPAPKA